MRRFLCVLLLCVMATSCALAGDLAEATSAIFAEVQARRPGQVAEKIETAESGAWLSLTAQFSDMDYTQWLGVVYDTEAAAFVTWDDLFADGDAAAARIAEIAEAATYDNAYSEHNQITPVPRDNFAVADGQLTVYYPPEQLSHFSGRAGAYAFYAYELEGLLRDGVPLAAGDPADAVALRDDVLQSGALPGWLADWPLGTALAAADEALGLVDVPDQAREETIWRFEAPQMRGVTLLSALGDAQAETAVVTGIEARRIDFAGLRPGLSTKDECLAALGEPAEAQALEEDDAYARLPQGETLIWTGNGRALAFHFVQDVLHSITLMET